MTVRPFFEYKDYIAQPTRENASECIASVMDLNITDVATKEIMWAILPTVQAWND